MSRVDVVHVLPDARMLAGTERTVLDLLSSPQLRDVRQRVAFTRAGVVRGFPEQLVLQPGRLMRPLGPLGVALTVARARPRIVHGWLLRGNAVGSLVRLLRPATRLVSSERNVGHNLTRGKLLLERSVAACEAAVTANSGAVADAALQRVPGRATKLQVILPGIERPARPPRIEACTAVMVGRLHPVKDHLTALRAWARVRREHPSASIAVVGDGPLRLELEEVAASLGLAGAVLWVGDADPLPFLFGARLFLSASRAEGFSRALLEAVCAGVPCVCTDVGGVAELPRGAALVVGVSDERALADAVCDVLADADARARARHIATVACERFSRERCHDEYRRLYRRLGVA